MRGPLIAVVAIALLLGCTEDPTGVADGTTPGQPNTPGAIGASPLRAPVSSRDLTGDWVFGERTEPGAGAIATCNPPQSLRLTQADEILTGQVSSCSSSCNTIESFQGTNQEGVVQAAGQYKGNLSRSPEPVTYILRYDAATQHLVGTRNGRKFWAAPWVTPEPGCGSSASPTI